MVTTPEMTEILETLKAYHQAIDLLFARLIKLDPNFYPSQSGKPWDAIVKGKALIDKLS